MYLNYVANGMGGQSMYLLYLATQKLIPATISITADTGWETDCDLNDGTKITAEEFYAKHIKPFADKWGIDSYFVRAVDKNKNPLPSIPEYLRHKVAIGQPKALPVPMFGSEGGRLKQSCTDKWKISAMKQQCRRLGATTARSAQGIHFGERARRVKGEYIGNEDGFSIYKTGTLNKETGVITTVKWLTHYYPLVDMQMNRSDVADELNRLGLPYLISSECGGCPHADPWRWLRRKPETIEEAAKLEELYGGEYFLTSQRRPLREVIADFRENVANQSTLFGDSSSFDCTGGWCGI